MVWKQQSGASQFLSGCVGAAFSLTPALSHPMGEGEPFAVLLENANEDLPSARVKQTKQPMAVPSPVGRERVRVRVNVPPLPSWRALFAIH